MKVADVIGSKVQILDVQRMLGIICVEVVNVAIDDSETVDLEWVNILQRVLPSLLMERDLVLLLSLELRCINTHGRMRKQHVSDDMSGEQFAPLDSELHLIH